MAIKRFQGHTAFLGDRVYVVSTAVIIGNVHIGDHSSVWPMTMIRGDIHQ